MKVTPYLMLYGRGDEAIQFYTKAVGAKPAMVMHFKDAPDKSMIAPGTENQPVGGHVFEATVAVTLEVHLESFDEPVARELDDDIGLKLLDL